MDHTSNSRYEIPNFIKWSIKFSQFPKNGISQNRLINPSHGMFYTMEQSTLWNVLHHGTVHITECSTPWNSSHHQAVHIMDVELLWKALITVFTHLLCGKILIISKNISCIQLAIFVVSSFLKHTPLYREISPQSTYVRCCLSHSLVALKTNGFQ